MLKMLALLMVVASLSCSDTRVVQRRGDPNDTPFGGGFPPNQRPDGDSFGRESRRSEVRLQYRGDNGAPETRVDPRVDPRTQ
jgi:hypothetical protein